MRLYRLTTAFASDESVRRHGGLDSLGRGKHIAHLRSMLEHHGLLSPRDDHLGQRALVLDRQHPHAALPFW
jgi:hypothetical protein